MVIENVRGAQEWVGRSRWNFGSFHLWGDVPALMPMGAKIKAPGMNWSNPELRGQDFTRIAGRHAIAAADDAGCKNFTPHGQPLGKNELGRRYGSKSKARKAASARIAKIPLPLSQYIARTFKPEHSEAAA